MNLKTNPYICSVIKNKDTIMKTNVKKVKKTKYDWLLKVSRSISEGPSKSRYMNCWDMTKEEVMAIADSYSSCDTVVRVYRLEEFI